MSARSAGAWLLNAALTVAVFAIAWQLWERVPGWVRGTPLAPYKELMSVLAVFAALSALDSAYDLGRALHARFRKAA